MSYSNPAKDIYPEAGYVNGKYTWQYRICPETPMVLDIAAMQYLYGANMQYHSGDDRYTKFDPTQPFFKTLWDAAAGIPYLPAAIPWIVCTGFNARALFQPADCASRQYGWRHTHL